MTAPHPTNEAIKQPSKAYAKFTPARSVLVERHIERHIEPPKEHVPDADRLDELRREDAAYLHQLAESQHQQALHLLETEIRERDSFTRLRAALPRRVSVAETVRSRADPPRFGRLGLVGVIRKRRAGSRSGAGEHGNPASLQGSTRGTSDDTAVGCSKGAGENFQCVDLVAAYESSSDDEEHIVKSDAACERTERCDRD